MQHKWLFLAVPHDKPQGRICHPGGLLATQDVQVATLALGTCAPVPHLAGAALGKCCLASRALLHTAFISPFAQEVVSHHPLVL